MHDRYRKTKCFAKFDTKTKKKFFAFCLRLIKIWKIQWKKTKQKNARFAETMKNDQMINVFNENRKKRKYFRDHVLIQ